MNKNQERQSQCCQSSPSVITVQTVEGLKGLSNCFVNVISNNTCYFVDMCSNITIISSGPVFVADYDAAANPLDLRAQVCYDFAKNLAYVFNELGEYRTLTLEGGE